jgi:hypothetical protein
MQAEAFRRDGFFLQLLELFKRNKSLSFVLLSIYQPAQLGFLLAFSVVVVVVVVFEGRCCFSPSTAFAACMYVPQNTG